MELLAILAFGGGALFGEDSLSPVAALKYGLDLVLPIFDYISLLSTGEDVSGATTSGSLGWVSVAFQPPALLPETLWADWNLNQCGDFDILVD